MQLQAGRMAGALAVALALACAGRPPTPEEVRALLEGGRSAEAFAAARRLVGSAERAGDPQGLAQALDLAATACWQAGEQRDPGCLPWTRRRLEARARLDGEGPALLAPLGDVFQVLVVAAQLEEAEAILDRMLALQRRQFPPPSLEVAQVLNQRANFLLFQRADPRAAAAVFAEVVEMRRAAVGEAHVSVAQGLHNLGLALGVAGESRRAVELESEAAGRLEALVGPDHPHLAVVLENRANQLARLGEYEAARRDYERTRDIRQAALGPDHPLVGFALHNLGWFDLALFDGARAAVSLEQALAVFRRAAGDQRYHVAAALENLGAAAALADDLEGAAARLREAAEVFAGLPGAASDHGRALAGLAEIALEAGRTEEALAGFEAALAALPPSDVKPGVEDTVLVGLAKARLAEGRHEEAREPLERALILRRKRLGEAHPAVAEPVALLAEVERRAGHGRQAIELALAAEARQRRHLRLTLQALTERQALGYAARRVPALDVAIAQGLAEAGADQALVARLWTELARSRAVVLDEMLARRAVEASGEDGERARRREALLAARRELAALVWQEKPAAEVERAAAAREAAERALAQAGEGGHAATGEKEITLEALLATLAPEDALAAFVRLRADPVRAGSEVYAAFVAGPRIAGPPTAGLRIAGPPTAGQGTASLPSGSQGRRLAFVSLGEAAWVDEAVAAWRAAAAAAPDPLAPAAAAARLAEAGEALRRAAWDPVVEHIAMRPRRLFLVPDGSLHLVAWGGLPASGGGFLAESGPAVHLLSAERDLRLAATPPAPRGGRLLAVGWPAYGEAAAAPGRAGACPRPAFAPLPATAQEIEAVARAWAIRGTARVLSGSGATEGAVIEAAAGADVLHVATHAFVAGPACPGGGGRAGGGTLAEHPLLASGLAFAGANEPAGGGLQDGLLTADEIAGLDLRGLDLVVLSACGTGLGELRAGEGVLGLRRAFEQAGAKSVVTSLWAVDDEAARDWMGSFYRLLAAGEPVAEAVEAASLAALHQRRTAGLPDHPFYWAAFAASGDWR